MKVEEIDLKDISLETLTKMWEKANKKPEPPELGHGEGGFDRFGNPYIVVRAIGAYSRDEHIANSCILTVLTELTGKTKIFNAFADLAAIKVAMEAGDVKDFTFNPDGSNRIDVSTAMNTIITTEEASQQAAALTLPELKQFIIKLRALVAVLEQDNE